MRPQTISQLALTKLTILAAKSAFNPAMSAVQGNKKLAVILKVIQSALFKAATVLLCLTF